MWPIKFRSQSQQNRLKTLLVETVVVVAAHLRQFTAQTGMKTDTVATAAGLSTGVTDMTITRARKITRQFAHNFVDTMRPEEATEYKSVVDDAIEWSKVNEPSLFYGIVHDYLNFLDRHTEHHICSTCKHWEPFTGACCGADSPHCADFVDDDCTCTDWKARLKK